MPLRLTNPAPYVVTIDGEPVRLQLADMTEIEYVAFAAQFRAFGNGRGKPAGVNGQDADLEALVKYRQANARWMRESFDQFVKVAAGDVTIDDQPLTNGAEFLDRCLKSHEGVITDVLSALLLQNSLTPAQKKTLSSRLASAIGSVDSPQTPSGDAPATAAPSAAPPHSVAVAAVTAPNSDASSGITAPSPSTPAPSEN